MMDQKIRDAALLLPAEEHAQIFRQLLKLEKGQGVIFASSDLHEDGITSLFSEVKPLLEGAIKLSDVTIFAGTDSEYESNAEVIRRVKEIEQRFREEAKNGIKRTKKEKHEYLISVVEDILLEKAKSDAAWRKKLAEEKPETTFIEVGGNHSNFSAFREELTTLSNRCKNYHFGFELGTMRLGKHRNGDLVFVTHSHHQLDDAGVVEDGFTDYRMGFLTLRQMAEKAIEIARTEVAADTNLEWAKRKFTPLVPDLRPGSIYGGIKNLITNPLSTIRRWAVKTVEVVITPRAELQEQWQDLVTFFRKPVSTARKIHRELGYRAVLGSALEQLEKGEDVESISTENLENQLKVRITKIDRKLDELPKEGLGVLEREGRRKAYIREKRTLTGHLRQIGEAKEMLAKSSDRSGALSWLRKEVLHVVTPEEEKPILFTMEHFNGMNILFSGHTHVRSTGVWVDKETSKGVRVVKEKSVDKPADKEIDKDVRKDEEMARKMTEYVNLGSATERILTDDYGKKASGRPLNIKLENIGAALAVYDVQTGKIDRVISIGNLIAENRTLYESLVVEKAGPDRVVQAQETALEQERRENVIEGLEKFRAAKEAARWAGRGGF